MHLSFSTTCESILFHIEYKIWTMFGSFYGGLLIQSQLIQGLLFAYIFTLLANLIVGIIQYRQSRNRLQLNMVAIWVSTIFIIFSYFLIENLGARIAGFVAAPLLFFNFVLYAIFFSDVRRISFSIKKPLFFFILGYLMSIGLYFLDVPFTYFAMPTLVAAVFPVFLLAYRTIKYQFVPFTPPQVIFLVNQVALALINLTWNPERVSPGLVFMGFAVSLITGQIHAIIVPIVGNDAIFKEKTDGLENEISKRVTELTLVRKQLWESNKNATIGRMAGGLAHEINSALSLINIQADLLDKKNSLKTIDQTFIKDSVLRIQKNVERLGNITSSLRKIAKDEGERSRSVYDIDSILHEVLIHYNERFDKLGVHVEVNSPGYPLFIKINGSDISHVVIQLLNNALEAIEYLPEKYIKILVKSDSNSVFVEIEDSGTMTAEAAEQIMQPFFTRKSAGRGIGLGLSVSQSIIEGHGGHLYLDKSSKNTRFVFTIPRTKLQPLDTRSEGIEHEQRKDLDR